MSKIDPTELGNKLDRRSTLLLQAARSNTKKYDEKDITAMEDPGIDSIRGSIGVVGSIIRARSARRLSQSSKMTGSASFASGHYGLPSNPRDPLAGMQRHQLYDAPVPAFSADGISDRGSISTTALPPRTPTIKFGTEEVIHKYLPTSSGDSGATHERREVSHRSVSPNTALQSIAESSGSTDGLTLVQPRPQTASSSFLSTSNLNVGGQAPSPKSAPANLFDPSGASSRFQDPFDDLPATASGAYGDRSRGSVTQPLPHRATFGDDRDRDLWEEPRKGRLHTHRPSERRDYPKGSVDLDRDESISLVNDPADDDDYDIPDADDADSINKGGIRLVGQSSGRGRF